MKLFNYESLYFPSAKAEINLSIGLIAYQRPKSMDYYDNTSYQYGFIVILAAFIAINKSLS